MARSRASIFEEAVELDVSGFAPKSAPDAGAPPAEEVRAIAEATNFRSRQVQSAKPVMPVKRKTRRYRTGRNVQLNVKASQQTVDAFYSTTEKQEWVLGYTLERAIHALERELEEGPQP